MIWPLYVDLNQALWEWSLPRISFHGCRYDNGPKSSGYDITLNDKDGVSNNGR